MLFYLYFTISGDLNLSVVHVYTVQYTEYT